MIMAFGFIRRALRKQALITSLPGLGTAGATGQWGLDLDYGKNKMAQK